MLHVAGWYDPYCGSMFDNYVGLSLRKRSPNRLVVGPWTQGANARAYAGDVEFGAAAAVPRSRGRRVERPWSGSSP